MASSRRSRTATRWADPAGKRRKREHELTGDDVIGAKAGRHGHHLHQAQPEQRGTREQNKRERDLRDDESMAKALSGATDRARAGFRSECILGMAAQVEPRDRHRDDDSQKNGASQANRRQPAIERNVRPERQAIRAKNFKQPNSRWRPPQGRAIRQGRSGAASQPSLDSPHAGGWRPSIGGSPFPSCARSRESAAG